ncbi:hypothetical protein WDU94_013580, partial [Cyamophila willieti]
MFIQASAKNKKELYNGSTIDQYYDAGTQGDTFEKDTAGSIGKNMETMVELNSLNTESAEQSTITNDSDVIGNTHQHTESMVGTDLLTSTEFTGIMQNTNTSTQEIFGDSQDILMTRTPKKRFKYNQYVLMEGTGCHSISPSDTSQDTLSMEDTEDQSDHLTITSQDGTTKESASQRTQNSTIISQDETIQASTAKNSKDATQDSTTQETQNSSSTKGMQGIQDSSTQGTQRSINILDDLFSQDIKQLDSEDHTPAKRQPPISRITQEEFLCSPIELVSSSEGVTVETKLELNQRSNPLLTGKVKKPLKRTLKGEVKKLKSENKNKENTSKPNDGAKVTKRSKNNASKPDTEMSKQPKSQIAKRPKKTPLLQTPVKKSPMTPTSRPEDTLSNMFHTPVDTSALDSVQCLKEGTSTQLHSNKNLKQMNKSKKDTISAPQADTLDSNNNTMLESETASTSRSQPDYYGTNKTRSPFSTPNAKAYPVTPLSFAPITPFTTPFTPIEITPLIRTLDGTPSQDLQRTLEGESVVKNLMECDASSMQDTESEAISSQNTPR